MTPSREIHPKVARVLAEALGVDEDDVIPSATLQGDLGAESIDFLDIVFRLEREFRIKIPRGSCSPTRSSGAGPISCRTAASPIGAWSSYGRGCLMLTLPISSATGVSAPSPIFSRSSCSSAMSDGSSVGTAGRCRPIERTQRSGGSRRPCTSRSRPVDDRGSVPSFRREP